MSQVQAVSPSHDLWSADEHQLLRQLQTTTAGLTDAAALARQDPSAARRDADRTPSRLWLFLSQLQNSLTIILILAALVSFFLHDRVDAVIILAIILASASLGFWQEYTAAGALRHLLSLVQIQSTVVRGGREQTIPAGDVLPGDVITFSAGSTIPADCRLLESKDLFVDEAALTGETFPADKHVGVLPVITTLAQRSNVVYRGTHVVSGTARAVVVNVGDATEFGKISGRLRRPPPETSFEQGVRRFGYFLMEITLLLVVVIFAINVYFHKPVIDAFLFSLALAVGLTPQLLPAIISVNLAHGARRMAASDVIVRRLSSIENFGSMNVLCSDKTGTLTQGIVHVHEALDSNGQASDRVMLYAYINSSFESGFVNPIDVAIRDSLHYSLQEYKKLDECPYDFIRKRLSILTQHGGQALLITKGATQNVLEACTKVEIEGQLQPLPQHLDGISARYLQFGNQGFRTLGVAYRRLDGATRIAKEDESDMVFLGMLVLRDPPKENVVETIRQLASLGISLKMITGDNERVAAGIASQVGLPADAILTGQDLRQLSDAALVQQVNRVSVFADVEPNQKERIILACKKAGNVVGYLGDGINDATALHAADVGISVDKAVDVAKEAADIVLMKQDLAVLVQGVREGRMTFANTMKYIFMATSANFGNMFSMAGASLFLDFLPLLPKQILLTNLLTDLPEMTIAGDSVDEDLLTQPQRWELGFIRRFMLTFGTISSVFDYLTFAILVLVLKASTDQFRTAWFLESVISATLIVLVVRTRRPFLRSLPGRGLLVATAAVGVATLILPWTPLAPTLGFQPLPVLYLLILAAIVTAYIITAEAAKRIFYRRLSDATGKRQVQEPDE